jgi:hypothetical protein
MLNIFSFDESTRLVFLGLDFFDFLDGFHFNLSLEKVDLFNVQVMLVGHHHLQIVSFQSQKGFVLAVVDDQ